MYFCIKYSTVALCLVFIYRIIQLCIDHFLSLSLSYA